MTEPEGILSVVAFQSGGLRFAVESSAVAAMLTSAPDAVCFASLMGLQPKNDAPSRILALRQGDKVFPVVVDEPVLNRDIPHQMIQPLPPMLDARLTKRTIRAVMWDDDGLVILLTL